MPRPLLVGHGVARLGGLPAFGGWHEAGARHIALGQKLGRVCRILWGIKGAWSASAEP